MTKDTNVCCLLSTVIGDLDSAEVGLLDGQHVDVAEAAERVGLERLQIHERQLDQPHGVQATERVRLQSLDARGQQEMLHVGEARERRGLHLLDGVVVEEE